MNKYNSEKLLNVQNEYINETSLKIQRVIYLTNTNWLLDKNKNTVSWWKIFLKNINLEKEKYIKYIIEWKSDNWTWWMWSKIDCAFAVLKNWVKESIIANAKNWLLCLKNDYESTKFCVEDEGWK